MGININNIHCSGSDGKHKIHAIDPVNWNLRLYDNDNGFKKKHAGESSEYFHVGQIVPSNLRSDPLNAKTI